METIIINNEFTMNVPESDLNFLKEFVHKMGWTLTKKRKSGLEKALEDEKEGRVFEANDVDDMFKQILDE